MHKSFIGRLWHGILAYEMNVAAATIAKEAVKEFLEHPASRKTLCSRCHWSAEQNLSLSPDVNNPGFGP
jgi:hypothetical protein